MFFFEPVQLELELPDLLIEQRDLVLGVISLRFMGLFKEGNNALGDLLFPDVDLGGMHIMLLGNLAQRLAFADSLQRDLAFLLGTKCASGTSHVGNGLRDKRYIGITL